MALKRKRSTATLAIDSPLSTSYNSPSLPTDGQLPFVFAQTKPIDALYQKPTWAFPTYESDDVNSTHHLGSRTRKRHRDDRPDENSVHVSTISKLFNAQRQYPHAEPVLSSSQPPHTNPAALPIQRSTLHSFWNINSRPTAQETDSAMSIDTGPDTQTDTELKCEDCDTPLQGQDAMELDEGMFTQLTECHNCRRRICDCCAVLGDQRECLSCATSGR